MFYKLFIPTIKPNLKKIIVLDCDLIVLQDIKEYFEEDMGGYSVACTGIDDFTLTTYRGVCVNGGSFLIDVNKWNEEGIFEKLVKTHSIILNSGMNISVISLNDDSLLSVVLNGNFKRMRRRYNCNCFDSSINDIFIRHYDSGGGRPWEKVKVKNDDIFWYYASMTPYYNEIHTKYIAYQINPLLDKIERLNVNINNIINEIRILKNEIIIEQSLKYKIVRGKKYRRYPKLLVNIICWFIPKKKNKRRFRGKHL